ncbi:MAG: hypothetical protein FWE04_01310 [Oscillospiraceae bacterium]|nr:hypothetical protein [Oscillospiraceae bacterium]
MNLQNLTLFAKIENKSAKQRQAAELTPPLVRQAEPTFPMLELEPMSTPSFEESATRLLVPNLLEMQRRGEQVLSLVPPMEVARNSEERTRNAYIRRMRDENAVQPPLQSPLDRLMNPPQPPQPQLQFEVAPPPVFVTGRNSIPENNRTNLWGIEIWQRANNFVDTTLNFDRATARTGNYIANWARNIGAEHAKANNWLGADGELITWDNEADALRHFVWNARMTREIGNAAATRIADNREVFTWTHTNIQGGTAVRIGFNSLMDLHNNEMGRLYAETFPHLDYRELFDRAMADGNIITCVEEVQRMFGFRNDHIFSNEQGNARHVIRFLPTNSNEPWHYMTYEEFNHRRRN